MKNRCCFFGLIMVMLCMPVLGENSRGNLTTLSPEEISNLSDILTEQQYSGDKSVDLSVFVKYTTHSGKLHLPEDYLNDKELSEVISSSNELIQSYQDLINQTKILLDQGKINESFQSYEKLVKLDSALGDIWSCKCSAMHLIEGKEGFNSNEPPGSMICDSDAEQIKYRKDPGFESLKGDMERTKNAITTQTRLKAERVVYQAVFNASGINITNGLYQSSRVFVPMGPYKMSFLIRTLGDMTVDNSTISRFAGSGKTYHMENFTVYKFNMLPDLHRKSDLAISIAQYTGPTSIKPEDPFVDSHLPDSNHSIKIDGVSGYNFGSEVIYQPDVNTFVQISSSLDFDRDYSLILDTIHIAKGNE